MDFPFDAQIDTQRSLPILMQTNRYPSYPIYSPQHTYTIDLAHYTYY
jgi:hypothetical protein